MENTITERRGLDAASQQFVQSVRGDGIDVDNDLAVDGLSESLMSRIFSLFMFRGD
ncbi:MAG: hypothetical protein U5K76_11790 [Woeseiaceae bacterium]|nr:hypothetical protein [Woeseiaceae bacterium]